MRLRQIFVAASALLFIAIGAALLINPEFLSAVDMAPTTPTGFADARADYGGATLGVGLFLMLAVFRSPWITPALWAIGIILGCYALGRVTSLMLDGKPRPIIYYLLAFEVVGSLCAFALLRFKS